MLGESEYSRAYKSPEQLPAAVSRQTAGLKSVGTASTEEPSFPHKRKIQDHPKRVSFSRDVVENTLCEDAALRYKAGVRRPSTPLMTTEYQTHFTWKQLSSSAQGKEQVHSKEHQEEEGTEQTTPIDQEMTLSAARETTHYQGKEDSGSVGEKMRGSYRRQEPMETEGLAAPGKNTNGRHVSDSVPSTTDKGLKSSSKKGCCKKKKHGGWSSSLTTEYRTQFKAPSQVFKSHLEAGTDSVATVPTGRPDAKSATISTRRPDAKSATVPTERPDTKSAKMQQKTDSVLWTPRVETVWSSEYGANFVMPNTLTYRKGAWIGAPHPDMYPPSPPRAATGSQQSETWFDQVVELRQEAEAYKLRQLSDHLIPSDDDHSNHSDSSCSSNSAESSDDSAVMPGTSHGATGVRAFARGSAEPNEPQVCVEDLEEEEERRRGTEEEEEEGRTEEEEVEERGRTKEVDEEVPLHASESQRIGQRKYNFLSRDGGVQQADTYNLRQSKPPRLNLNVQLEDRNSSETQAPNEVLSHNEASTTSGGVADGGDHSPSNTPPSHPSHSPTPPPPPAAPSTSNDQQTAHARPHPRATWPAPIYPVSSSRPPHLTAAKQKKPVPSSMAFSIPLSPGRPKVGTEQWTSFVRKKNKDQSERKMTGKGVMPKARPVETSTSSRKVDPIMSSHKKISSEVGAAGHVKPNPPFVAAHMATNGRRGTHRCNEEPGGLSTCKTCGAYLFASKLSRGEEPQLSNPTLGSNCQICAKGQKHAVSTSNPEIPVHKPVKVHTILGRHTDSSHRPVGSETHSAVPLSRAREPAAHMSRLERHSSELSLSSLSSCSVASDVLARARERKDFWSSTAPLATE